MDYFQGVVTEYLRANRETFVNTECLIQLDIGDPPTKGRHWYCDAVAVNFREHAVYLCEVTYSATLQSLLSRLSAWSAHWPDLKAAIARDCGVPPEWRVQPWVFIPADRGSLFKKKMEGIHHAEADPAVMPRPKETYLESVTPWMYRTWDRKLVLLEDDIPGDLQSTLPTAIGTVNQEK